ncbi:MAG: transporter substrate-binding domain-containing protein [Clostridia bacterium]|nr:transporter substrate-binding domain-containing protein [Clostridia bacterium]NCC75262.1 transporter substrate-binding domain-containing protein [Clostridia bacterium]
MNTKILRSVAVVLALTLVLMLAAACKPAESTRLVVGMELAYPPFETTDSSNKPTGISVDLAKALGEKLGREVVIENIAWSGLIPALETGKIDLVISSMTITEERQKTIDFSDPYAMSNLALLIGIDSPVQSYSDLAQPGRVLAVKKGSTGHVYAEKNLPADNYRVFDKESACILEVVQGKADAFTYDQLTIFRNWQDNEDKTRVNLASYQEKPEYWGIGLKKGNDKLKADVNAFIAEFQSAGGFDKLAETYLTEEQKTFADLGIPFFFDVA